MRIFWRRFKYSFLSDIREIYRKYLWRSNRDNGIVVASYPKSGNTYLRLLLADCLRETTTSVGYDELDEVIPYVGTKVSESGFYKSHETARTHILDNVLFIHRCPSEVFESLFRSLKRRGLEYNRETMIRDFEKGNLVGYEGYLEYLRNWVSLAEENAKVRLIDYRNLISHPDVLLRDILPFLDETDIAAAVEANNIKRVREKERQSLNLKRQGINDLGTIAGAGSRYIESHPILLKMDKDYWDMFRDDE